MRIGRRSKRFLAFALLFCMLAGLVPPAAFAAGGAVVSPEGDMLTMGVGNGSRVATGDDDGLSWASARWSEASLEAYTYKDGILDIGDSDMLELDLVVTLSTENLESGEVRIPMGIDSLIRNHDVHKEIRFSYWEDGDGVEHEDPYEWWTCGRWCESYLYSNEAEDWAKVTSNHDTEEFVIKYKRSSDVGGVASIVLHYVVDGGHIFSGSALELAYSVSQVRADGSSASFERQADGFTVLTNLGLSVYSYTWNAGPFWTVDQRSDQYVKTWVPAYEEYFGVTEENFYELEDDGDGSGDLKWAYDIIGINLEPSGAKPYDISGVFVPGSYPCTYVSENTTSAESNIRDTDMAEEMVGYDLSQAGSSMLGGASAVVNGWDGELVGVLYSGDGYIKVPFEARKASYAELPGSDPEFEDGHEWNVYDFGSIRDVLSPDYDPDFDGGFDRNGIGMYGGHVERYRLVFMVRWNRRSESIEIPATEWSTSSRRLSYTVGVRHTGIDDREDAVSILTGGTAYSGIFDDSAYDGAFYSANYASKSENVSGIDLLRRGYPVSFSRSAWWFANNTLRGSAVRDTAVMEAVIDNVFLAGAGADGGTARLGAGDYRISRYYIHVNDRYGVANGANVVWDMSTVEETFKAHDQDLTIDVYYSPTLSGDGAGDDWVLLDQIPFRDMWDGIDWVDVDEDIDALRLKVVFKESMFITWMDVAYDVQLLPDGPGVKNAVRNAKIGDRYVDLTLTQWLGYAAYKSSEYEDRIPDLIAGRNNIWGDTAEWVRSKDEIDPWPGYGGEDYIYRQRTTSILSGVPDSASIAVSQNLYKGSYNGRELIGEWSNNASTSSATVTAGSDISRVEYAVFSFVGDAGYGNEASIISKHELDSAGGIASSPYASTHQRYFVLLPEGLELEEQRYGWETEISVYVGGGGPITVMPDALGTSASYGSTLGEAYSGNARAFYQESWGGEYLRTLKPSVSTEWIGNRQLVVVDIDYGDVESYEIGFIRDPYDYNVRHYVHGVGFTLHAVPASGLTLGAGSYETLFASEFLYDDGSGDPAAISLGDYTDAAYRSVSDAFGSKAGGNVDDDAILAGDGGNAIVATSTRFMNTPGGMAAYAEAKVREGRSPDSVGQVPGNYKYDVESPVAGGKYSYALTYFLSGGRSSDVVLWDAVEDYDRYGISSDFHGVLESVDLNGFGDAVVYVNRWDGLDLDAYSGIGADAGIGGRYRSMLEAGEDGWVRVADPVRYDYSGVKAIAVSFGDREFEAGESATVYLNMRVPDEVLEAVAAGGAYDYMAAYNELYFSNRVVGDYSTVRTNRTRVRLTTDAEPEKHDISVFKHGYGETPLADAQFYLIEHSRSISVTFRDSSGTYEDEVHASVPYRGQDGSYLDLFRAVGWELDSYGLPAMRDGSMIFGRWDRAVDSAGNVTYVASWESARTVTVTFTDGCEDEDLFADQVYPDVLERGYGYNYDDLFFGSEPVRDGYMFNGWSMERDADGNVTCAARWTKSRTRVLTVICVDIDGNPIDGAEWTFEYPYGEYYTVSGLFGEYGSYPELDGYWYKHERNMSDPTSGRMDRDRFVYLVYDKPWATVYYDANGGSGAPASETRYLDADGYASFVVSSTVPTKPGFVFLGWARSSYGGVSWRAGDAFSTAGSMMLYAVWADENALVTVYYMAGDHGSGFYEDKVVVTGEYTVRNPTVVGISGAEGYAFSHWQAMDGTTYYPGDSIPVTGMAIMLMAVWTQMASYTVSWFDIATGRLIKDTEIRWGFAGDRVSVSDNPGDMSVPGYVYVPGYGLNMDSAILTEAGSVALVLYFMKEDSPVADVDSLRAVSVSPFAGGAGDVSVNYAYVGSQANAGYGIATMSLTDNIRDLADGESFADYYGNEELYRWFMEVYSYEMWPLAFFETEDEIMQYPELGGSSVMRLVEVKAAGDVLDGYEPGDAVYRPWTFQDGEAGIGYVHIMTTGDTGMIYLQGIEDGLYTLVESRAPENYVRPDEPHMFVVDGEKADAGHLLYEIDWDQEDDRDLRFVPVGGNDPSRLSIENVIDYERVVELPKTGGVGTVPFHAFGAVLIACAGAVYAGKKRWKDRKGRT